MKRTRPRRLCALLKWGTDWVDTDDTPKAKPMRMNGPAVSDVRFQISD